MNIETLKKNKSLIHLVDLNFQNLRDIQLHMPSSFKTFYKILLSKSIGVRNAGDGDLQNANIGFIQSLSVADLKTAIIYRDYYFCFFNKISDFKTNREEMFILSKIEKHFDELHDILGALDYKRHIFLRDTRSKDCFTNLLQRVDYSLFEKMVNSLDKKVISSLLSYLILKKSNFLIPENEDGEKRLVHFLTTAGKVPANNVINRKYMSNLETGSLEGCYLTHPDLISETLKNDSNVKNILLDDIKFQNLKPEFVNNISNEKLAELFKTVKDPSLIKPLMVDQEKIDAIFLLLKKTDLSLMTLVSKETLRKNYEEIKSLITKGVRVGKQGLKYFCIVNSDKLNLAFIYFVLNKYPKFHNSINKNMLIVKDYGGCSYGEKYKLKTLVFKKKINSDEHQFLKDNIHRVAKFLYKDNYNKETKQALKSLLFD